MDPITLGLIGAGVGVAKHELIDVPQERRQTRLAAQTAAYSPWTGMTPQLPQHTNALGTGLQSGLVGFQLGQGMEMQNMQKNYMDQMIQRQQQMPMGAPKPMGGSP